MLCAFPQMAVPSRFSGNFSVEGLWGTSVQRSLDSSSCSDARVNYVLRTSLSYVSNCVESFKRG